MQKVFEASGYQFTIITPNDGEPHFMGREIAAALGYSKASNLSLHLQSKKFKTLVLNKYNGLPSFKKKLGSIKKHVSQLTLIPSSALQEYLLRHSKLPKAKEIGNILYKCLTQPEKKVEKKENALQKLLRTEVEALELDSEFRQWYMRHVDSIMFLFLLTIKPTSIQFAEGKDSSSFINSSCLI